MHLETSGLPMLDAGGNLAGYRGADTDVTQRRRSEEALADSQAQLLALFNGTEGHDLVRGPGAIRAHHVQQRALRITS